MRLRNTEAHRKADKDIRGRIVSGEAEGAGHICIKLGRMFTAAAGGSTENGALTPLGRMEKPEALPIDRGMRGNYNTHAMYIVQYILPYLHLYGKERLKWHPETNLRGTKW